MSNVIESGARTDNGLTLSEREEYMWLASSLAWNEYEQRLRVVLCCRCAALGMAVLIVAVTLIGPWWALAMPIALLITDAVLLEPWLKRQRAIIEAPWSLQCGMRHLCGVRR